MKKWSALFSTQFLGVLNDNLLKNLICFVGVMWLAEESRTEIISLAGALLVLPFILFSPLAGVLAVRKSKQFVVRIAKLIEIPIMLVASVGFLSEDIYMILVALFLMGLQSALYSPSKYGLIRDVGGADNIPYGTGTMEMLSFVAVLLGTVLAGVISDVDNLKSIIIVVALLGFALSGWLTSRKINVEESPVEVNPNVTINPVKFLVRNVKWARSIKGLNITILGLSAFWFIGALLQMNLIIHCPVELGFSNTQTSMVMAFMAVGIGLGCWLAGYISKKKIELGIVPIGAIGLSLCMTSIAIFDFGPKMF
ncbi:MAG: MFS transporter, partial [Flavobacteriales bacterium]|nr:MFS transporter [Flavobacteriales bacterium]